MSEVPETREKGKLTKKQLIYRTVMIGIIAVSVIGIAVLKFM